MLLEEQSLQFIQCLGNRQGFLARNLPDDLMVLGIHDLNHDLSVGIFQLELDILVRILNHVIDLVHGMLHLLHAGFRSLTLVRRCLILNRSLILAWRLTLARCLILDLILV